MSASSSTEMTSSSKGLTYSQFIRRLKDPRSKGVTSFIVEFVRNICESEVGNEDEECSGPRIQAFIRQVTTHLGKHVLWKDAAGPVITSTVEGLEKFIMTRVYKRVFAFDPEDVAMDEKIAKRIKMLSFVDFHHLDIAKSSPRYSDAWKRAADVLRKMDSYKAPRDKLITICNCCQFINGILSTPDDNDDEDDGKRASPSSGAFASEVHVGADEFLPALILVVLRSCPPRLHSNLSYIRKYRHPSLLVLAQRYFFTALESAVEFIWDIRETSLSMSAEEFRDHVKRVVASASQHPKSYEDANSVAASLLGGDLERRQDDEKREARDRSSVSSNSSAGSLLPRDDVDSSSPSSFLPRTTLNSPPAFLDEEQEEVDEEEEGSADGEKENAISDVATEVDDVEIAKWRSRRFRFRGLVDAGELRIDQVGALLDDYKELASMCERLLTEREQWLVALRRDKRRGERRGRTRRGRG